MAITDYASFLTKVANPTHVLQVHKSYPALQRVCSSSWIVGALNAGAPTTAAVPVSTTFGALGSDRPLRAPAVAHRIVQIRGHCAMPGRFWIVDRLSHQGGLSGTVTTAQTTNLPTAALTRYTTGEGVCLGAEIYTTIGTTGTTITVSYTNQAGTSGRTTVATAFGATNYREGNRILPLPLQAGDTGVRAVASATVLATTGTAGNFGITLFKPLLSFSVFQPGPFVWDAVEDGGGYAPEVLADACLTLHSVAVVATNFTGSQDIAFEILVAEDD